MLATIQFRILYLPVSYLNTWRLKYRAHSFSFTYCFVWVWNLVSHIKGKTQTEDVWEQVSVENIYA
jgi:hypothetical protein